jgi:hypothetical protein
MQALILRLNIIIILGIDILPKSIYTKKSQKKLGQCYLFFSKLNKKTSKHPLYFWQFYEVTNEGMRSKFALASSQNNDIAPNS